MSERPLRPGHGRAFPSACDHIWRMVKMMFGTDELGIEELRPRSFDSVVPISPPLPFPENQT